MRISTRPLPRGIRALLMTVAGIGLALVVTQCRMVGDGVLGPASGLSGSDSNQSLNCISFCAREYADSNKVESQLHTSNVHACGSDPVCATLEDIRHTAAVVRISNGRIACMDGCHHQGGGTGGR